MKLTSATVAAADVIIPITLADARRLPNLAGRIVSTMLAAHQFYAVTQVNDDHTRRRLLYALL